MLVVGGGKIAMRRVRTLLEFGCQITVVSPEVCEELREKVLWKKKRYDETDLESLGNVGEASRFVFVLAAAAPEVNEKIVCDCRKKKIPVNNASNRDQCDFYFPGIYMQEGLVVGITASGLDHKKARRIREEIQDALEKVAREDEEENDDEGDHWKQRE